MGRWTLGASEGTWASDRPEKREVPRTQVFHNQEVLSWALGLPSEDPGGLSHLRDKCLALDRLHHSSRPQYPPVK